MSMVINADPTRSRREQARADKRARIVAAARTLFATQGYEATTTRAIADAADIATGTLFLYAKTKGDVVLLVFEDTIGVLVNQALERANAEDDVVEALVQLFAVFLRKYAEDKALARVFIKELAFLDASARERREALEHDLFTRTAAFLSARQAQGQVRADVDTMLCAINAFALYFSALLAWLTGMTESVDDATALLRLQLRQHHQGMIP